MNTNNTIYRTDGCYKYTTDGAPSKQYNLLYIYAPGAKMNQYIFAINMRSFRLNYPLNWILQHFQ
jgi:hypothetical protein